MKNLSITLLLLLIAFGTEAVEKSYYISVGTDAVVKSSQSLIAPSMDILAEKDGVSLVKITDGDLRSIHHMMHEEMNRCAGFKRYDSLDEAKSDLQMSEDNQGFMNFIFADYSINKQDLVNSYINQVEPLNILATIEKLASFKNRYYQSQHGIDSQAWLKSKWESLVAHRTDASVEYFNHARWGQPSLILTLKGKSTDTIVIGGHADSISGYWGRKEARAPGADDNASGIATITEIIRVLVDNNYVPNKTIKFMGYAAEEVGLLGSKDIANTYKAKGENVVGVVQFDMTNYNGSKLDIVMMSDFTNKSQNEFLGRLIDEYLPSVSWGYDKCGYACSDHASWTAAGYPSSMPFEATMKEMNHKIHTANDTLSQSRNNTDHAQKFARLGLAFVTELDK